jgi:hypothetical protein
MAEFEVAGHHYRSRKMNARTQLHLLRGLGPLFGPMVQLALTDPADASQAARQLAFMVPFFDTFASMKKEEVDTLVDLCLAVTQRGEGGNGAGPAAWQEMRVGGRDMYDDIGVQELMTICWHVIQENLGGFFAIGAASPSSATDTTSRPATSPG